MTTLEAMQANPHMTYGFAVGYVSGIAAKARKAQFAGLSASEWRFATDDYAQGYRKGFGR